MPYVDGFVIPVPKKNLKTYRRIATLASKVWRDYGALEYRECVGDDLDIQGVFPFMKSVKAKPDETIVFAWIVYKSKAHRDRVNAKVMKDERIINAPKCPFDAKRMAYGGFKVFVEA